MLNQRIETRLLLQLSRQRSQFLPLSCHIFYSSVRNCCWNSLSATTMFMRNSLCMDSPLELWSGVHFFSKWTEIWRNLKGYSAKSEVKFGTVCLLMPGGYVLWGAPYCFPIGICFRKSWTLMDCEFLVTWMSHMRTLSFRTTLSFSELLWPHWTTLAGGLQRHSISTISKVPAWL